MARKSEEVSRAKGKRRIKYQRGSERGREAERGSVMFIVWLREFSRGPEGRGNRISMMMQSEWH